MRNGENELLLDQIHELYIEKRDKGLEAFKIMVDSRKNGLPKDACDKAYNNWKQLAFELDVAAEAFNTALCRVIDIDDDSKSRLNSAAERLIKSRIAIEKIYESSY
jgi:hypothetical protein